MRARIAATAGRPVWLLVAAALVFFAAESARTGPADQSGRADPSVSPSPVAISATQRADSRAPIRVGGIFNLSASAEPIGRQQFEAARLAVEQINAGGGVLVGSGQRRLIELVPYDDAGRPELTAAIVRRLSIEEDVVAIVGLSDAATATVAVVTAEQEQVPLVVLVAPDPDRSGGQSRWTFTLAHDQIDALTVVLEHVSGSQVERVGWIAPRTAAAEAARNHLVVDTAARGLRVVAEEPYSLLEQDLGERIARLATAGAEAIVGWPRGPEDAASIAKAAPRASRARIYLGPPAASDAFLTLAGEAGPGIRVPVTRLLLADDLWDHDPLTPATRELIRAFRLAYGYAPSITSAAAWDAVRLIAGAVDQAGPSRIAVRAAMERTSEFAGASGPISFAADDHVGLDRRAPLVARVVPGGWRIPP